MGTSLKSGGVLVRGDLHSGHTEVEATAESAAWERFTFVVDMTSCGAAAGAPICSPATSSVIAGVGCRTTRELAAGAATRDKSTGVEAEEAEGSSMEI